MEKNQENCFRNIIPKEKLIHCDRKENTIMTRNEVLEKILFIITEKLHIDTGVIGEDTLLQDIGVDSITLMTMVIYIEKEFNIKINFDEKISGENASPSIKNIINLIVKQQTI